MSSFNRHSTLNLLSAFQPKERYSRKSFTIQSKVGNNGASGRKNHPKHKSSSSTLDSGDDSAPEPSSTDFFLRMDNSQALEPDYFKRATSEVIPQSISGGGGGGVLPGLSVDDGVINKRDGGGDHGHHSKSRGKIRKMRLRNKTRIFDDPAVIAGYASVPILNIDPLPRGGISIETKAVGRIQFGIPPETIKDSMRLGYDVPEFLIVPVERFCREMGPALGINLAEFEFPAYFNYFVRQRKVTLIVDNEDAEKNIRSVFSETLLGPTQFRDHDFPKPNEEEDFDPSYEEEERPNFYREFYHFRTAEKSTNYQELTVDTLITFKHFHPNQEEGEEDRQKLGEPPTIEEDDYQQKDYRSDEDLTSMFEKTVRISVCAPEKIKTGGKVSIKLNPTATDATNTTNSTSTSTTLKISSDHDDPLDNCSERAARRRSSATDLNALSLAGLDAPPGGKTRRGSSFARRGSHPSGSRRGSVDKHGVRRLSMASRRSSADASRRSSLGGNSSRRGSTSSRRGSTETSSVHSSGHSSYDHSFGETSSMVGDDGTQRTSWMYSQVKWLGEVSTVYPPGATEEQRKTNQTKRAEIFKMPGGTEYVIHDVDENNVIIGKVRFSGTVRVPDEYAVEGFLAPDAAESVAAGLIAKASQAESDESDDDSLSHDDDDHHSLLDGSVDPCIPLAVIPPTFHPPSFGVTVLGNSHGFDKNGSTSGYVIWVNGRGVMVDPPPYSSSTLEREGIRPQMIMAVIITHCHADHDAGAFQKVLTGSKVAVITTPTIYKSFIRKYAALSGLSPALLRHSHRHRPAVIGQPLKFQGAKFHFRYSLHTIPCIAFKVEWRGRSMFFTGDHLNDPPRIQMLEDKGVLAKARADSLREIPLVECDALLHEAGAPPIHTPLAVLKELPDYVKNRLYVVHTSALPPDCGLRIAPIGTAGTIRLDDTGAKPPTQIVAVESGVASPPPSENNKESLLSGIDKASLDGRNYPNSSVSGDILPSNLSGYNVDTSRFKHQNALPLVMLRPTCVSDAWFILNLLSNIPFFSSLSYVYTMEVLEIAMVEVFCSHEVVVPAVKRPEILCVVWEGTCVEQRVSTANDASNPTMVAAPGDDSVSQYTLDSDDEDHLDGENSAVWHAGDWTGPVSLQPDVERSAESSTPDNLKDVVAISSEGVKAIIVQMKDLHRILKRGSKLFRKYLSVQEKQHEQGAALKVHVAGMDKFDDDDSQKGSDTLLEVIKFNSSLGRLSALQKRHLESIAEGPRLFQEGAFLWKVGEAVDFAFLIVSGNAAFGHTGKTFDDEEVSRGYFTERQEEDKLLTVQPNSEYARLELSLQVRMDRIERGIYDHPKDLLPKEEASLLARDRFANKVLSRLYARRAYTAGVVFSRGHFLSDVSRMVSGDLSGAALALPGEGAYTIGHTHSSNMVAGRGGCVVMVFQRSTLVPFLEANPGVLLCLLGSHAVV